MSDGEEEEEEPAKPSPMSPQALVNLLNSRISLYAEAIKTADGMKKRRYDRALKVSIIKWEVFIVQVYVYDYYSVSVPRIWSLST